MRNARVTGMVLAGGRSSRFGSDKARQIWRGRRLIDHAASALRSVSSELLISAGSGQESYDVAGARTVTDRFAGCGPLGGLHAGLLYAASPWLLVLACDMPRVTAGFLRGMLAEIRGGLSCVVSQTPDGRRHPLCAAYHTSLLPLVESHLRAGLFAMGALIGAAAGNVHYHEAAPELLVNVNRTQDLAGLEQAPC